jgi:hypothetical protein
VKISTEPAFDLGNWNKCKHKRDITELIEDLEKAKRAGWNEMKVSTDVSRLVGKQKAELKQARLSVILICGFTDWRRI